MKIKSLFDKAILILFLSAQASILMPLPASADWAGFSSSMNRALSSSEGHSIGKILALLAMVFIVVLGALYIRHQSRKEDEFLLNRKKFSLKPLDGNRKRYWFRLPMKMEFKWIPADEAEKVGENRYNRDSITNISGGGISFTTDKQLNPGDKLSLILDVQEKKPLFLNGEVVRIIEEIKEKDIIMYKTALRFEGIRPGQQDKIVALITKIQRANIPEKRK